MFFTTKVALIGDYNPSVTAHIAIPKAIAIVSQENDQSVEGVWVETENLAGVDSQGDP